HKKNEGEIPQYYVRENHEAIIPPETFDMVQTLIAARTSGKNRVSSTSIFSSKIKCGCCGGWYGSKVWHSNDKYRKVIWQCNHKFEDEKCTSPNLTEDEIKDIFLRTANRIISEKSEIIDTYRQAILPHLSTNDLEREKAELETDINVTAGLIEDAIRENAHIALDQAEYQTRYDSLVARFDKAKARLAEIDSDITQRQARRQRIDLYLQQLEQRELLTEFHEEDWLSMVDHMTVTAPDDVLVTFKDGTEIKA
ncbi:MAG: zinc ribbon domain-containing protein, partial [Bacteroidales bacterium]|nr:zinc ribbon domain-containing protein [Bacteroidales bacterium]